MPCIISACGDNCSVCPRYTAKTEAELHNVAELWYKLGFRDKVVTSDEIKCNGCSSKNNCKYGLFDCHKRHNVEKCNECNKYPCKTITDMLDLIEPIRLKSREICTDEEYNALAKAFFEKKQNLERL